jgi:hypothetical protein
LIAAIDSGYLLEQATRPQTIGYAPLDSPVALAAWLLDRDTDSYYGISRAFLDDQPAGPSHPGPDHRRHDAARGASVPVGHASQVSHATSVDRHRLSVATVRCWPGGNFG